jgi:hypothetical protein
VVSNTVNIITNVVSISSLAQTMASVMTSTTGGALTSTAESISNSNTGGSSDSNNENDSNESTGNNTGGSSTNDNSDQGNTQSQGNQNSVQGSGTNSNNQGGTASTGDSKTKGVASSGNNQAQGGNQEASSPVAPNTQTGSSLEGGSGSGSSGNTANSISNSIDGGSSDNSTTESTETKEGKSGGGSNLANSLSNAVDGGGSESSSSGGGGSKKESSAKASTGSLIASGDMVVIANADNTQPNQYKFVGSITHANTRGTRIKGILFNYTTQVNNFNVTFYKSYINKSRKLNTVVANSTMVNTARDIFNTTTALESYKITKKITGMFGLNATAGQLGERKFYNLSAVVGGHAPIQVTKSVSTSILVLGIYSPFTQFYEGQWWSAGILVVPFNSWDFKITKTFKFNLSAKAVYSYGESFLNYQVLTG